MHTNQPNFESATVKGFGQEWATYDQSGLSKNELDQLFQAYFKIFPFNKLDQATSIGADFGCGSGRWSGCLAPAVRHLYLIDASEAAIQTARLNLRSHKNLSFHRCSIEEFAVGSQKLDFAFSLGVLHHLPDVPRALIDIAENLKPGAPFLLYLYYALDGRSSWYRFIWRRSNQMRKIISRFPFGARNLLTKILAALVYWPLARTALVLEHLRILPLNFPLAFYRHRSFYVMMNDSLDRFGTRLEQRFTKMQITKMLTDAGFENISFSTSAPFWCSIAYKKM